MDLNKLFWKAIHSDKTITSENVEDKPYTKINRATLQKLVFFDTEKDEVEFKRPYNISKWDIRWRKRTRINQNGGEVLERLWVIDDGQFHIINEKLEHKTFPTNVEADKKPISNTPIDNL